MSIYFLKACEMLNTGGHDVAYLIVLFQEVKYVLVNFMLMFIIYYTVMIIVQSLIHC